MHPAMRKETTKALIIIIFNRIGKNQML